MPELPRLDCSLLVRTDFTSDDAWREARDQALRESEEGFGPTWNRSAILRSTAPDGRRSRRQYPLTKWRVGALHRRQHDAHRPDHPVLVVDLLDDDRRPFRCIPPELWGIDNNLNIANMDWAEFADAADENGVFRGFPP